MSVKSEKATANFDLGYNCCQAVVSAFDEIENVDTVLKLATSFGGGVGDMRQICGAVSAMAMVLGCKEGFATPEVGETKANQRVRVYDVCCEFREKAGSIVCGELLGLDGFTPLEKGRIYSCRELVELATLIVEQKIKNK